MSTYRLKNLLAPRSVALIGASARPVSVGRAVLENIRSAGFKGEFGLVNPRHAEIGGIAAVKSLDRLPFVPELVVITAPARKSLASSTRLGVAARRAHPDRLGRARPRTGVSVRGGNRRGPQIWYAADRSEQSRHHDAPR